MFSNINHVEKEREKTAKMENSTNLRKCVVVLSCYNGEEYLRDQIDSIINQKNVDLHLFIRNDGSTDGSMGILLEKQKEYSGMLSIQNGNNVGIHKSFYELLLSVKDVSFEYLAFSDQDDFWDLDKISCGINKMELERTDFYSSASRLVDGFLKPIGKTTSNQKKYDFYRKKSRVILTPGTQGCTIIITRKLYDFLIDSGVPDYYGHDTWITIVANMFFETTYDSDSHMSYRQHDQSWTGNRANRFAQFKREYSFFIKGLARYRLLARDIINRYDTLLGDVEKRLLLAVSKEKRSFSDKMRLFFSFKYRKYGFLENLVFKIYVLIGRA